MNNHSDSNKNRIIEALMKSTDGKIDERAAKKAMQGDASDAINALDEESKRKLMNVIADKQKMQKLLSSDAAQKLMQTLMGGEKDNG